MKYGGKKFGDMTQFSGIGIVSPEFRISERGLNWKYRHYEEVLNRSENLAIMESIKELLDGEDFNPIKYIGATPCVNANPLFQLNSLELFERSKGAFPFPVPFFGAFHFDRDDLGGFVGDSQKSDVY